jgi:hypothetical protein
MQWKLYCTVQPLVNTVCVVGRQHKNKNPSYGVLTYCSDINGNYWKDKYCNIIKCLPYDNWCAIDDIINAAQEKFIESLNDYFNMYK